MKPRLADFYIIGAMKSATSTLHEQLARRQAFFMSDPKEPNFFNDDRLYPAHMAWYESLFSAATAEQICGESSTHYTKLPTFEHTAERICKHTPNARFVYIMRHPIQRLVSHYIHEWTEGRAGSDISREVLTDPQYVEYSSYARQLTPYLEYFDKTQILPVFFECLTTSKVLELERVARFLGDTSAETFAWHSEVARTNVSSERMRKSRTRDALLSLRAVRVAKNILPAPVIESVKRIWMMRRRPVLSAEATQFVEQRFHADLSKLSDMLGCSINIDNFSEVARRSTLTFR